MKYIILTFTHGSVRTVVDGDTGTVLEANDYYPFGKRIPTPTAGSAAVSESAVTEPAEVNRLDGSTGSPPGQFRLRNNRSLSSSR